MRPLREQDISMVAELRRRHFRSSRWSTQGELERYLRRVFLEDPFADPEIASLVYEEADATISGFLGLVPRAFQIRGRPLRGAVATQFMVDSAATGFASLQLLKAAFEGKQDFLFADVGNGLVHPLWDRLGGVPVRLYTFFWTIPLRPLSTAMEGLGGSLPVRIARRVSRPLLGSLDAVLARGKLATTPETRSEPLDARAMVTLLPELVGKRSLRADYSVAALSSLLEQAAEKWGRDRLAMKLVSEDSDPIGWFVYVARPGEPAEVIQIIAKEGKHEAVVRQLARDAFAGGALLLRGRCEPAIIPELAHAGATFLHRGAGVLFHSRDPAISTSVLRGDALLTGLDGEWCLDF